MCTFVGVGSRQVSECSITEIRDREKKDAERKGFTRGFQPLSSDFRSQLNCNFK
jgi:hypothetical protein